MAVGDRIGGRFSIERMAGSGGMGTVYRALDAQTGAPVALKLLLVETEEQAARLAAEAEALAALDHPGIVRLIDHGATPTGQPFIAMEWFDGEDLAERLTRGRLSVAESVTLGRRVAEALAAAHARGVVHRDIKPSNLFLPAGAIARVTILDFGIARLTRAPSHLTATGMLMGTPGYMAPEQARGAKEIDARADLFALGAVLFECLAGRPAFAGEHVMAVLAKLLLEEAPRLRDLQADVPDALSELVARMLAKDPDARTSSAALVAEELGAIERDLAREGGGEAVRPARPRTPAPSAPAVAITVREQRLVSVIVARAPGPRQTGDASVTPTAATLPAAPDATLAAHPWGDLLDRVRAAALPLGARADILLDGSLIVAVTAAGSATDQAAQAARAALLLRRLAPEALIALVTALGDISGALPVGQVLDRAADLLAMPRLVAAGAVHVRTDAVTAGLLDVRFEVEDGPSGIELLGEREVGDGVRTLLGRPSPCVGRERELRALRDALDACAGDPAAQAVLVTAPAGAGKSRLRHELLQELKLRPGAVEVWSARGDPMTAGSAFAMLAAAIRGAAGAQPGEPLEERRRKLTARVSARVPPPDRARVAAFLGEISGTPFPEEGSALLASARQSSEIMTDQVRRAWGDFVAAECADRPVLLVLEDLHWGDAPSVALVDATLRRLAESPFMVLAFGRPEVHDLFPKLWGGRNLQEIRLGSLPRRASARLARHALGPEVSEDTVARIVERAAGNAFYLEEIIRAVAEGRADALPETVVAMVQARLDARSPEERRVLRAASVFGSVFWRGGVLALLGGETSSGPGAPGDPGAPGEGAGERLGAVLASLVEQELFVRHEESRFPGQEELAFRHALLREGAYATFTEADRALGHRLAGAWLAAAGESDPMQLGEHFERGGEPARASGYFARAAEQALVGNDAMSAIQRAGRSLACGVEGDRKLRLLAVLGEAHWSVGAWRDAEGYADEVLRIAAPGSAAWCSAVTGKLMARARGGEPTELLPLMEHLEGIEVTAENAAPIVMVLSVFAGSQQSEGRYDLAQRYQDRAERAAGGAASLPPLARGFLHHMVRMGRRLSLDADIWGSLLEVTRAIACYEEAGERRFQMVARMDLSYLYRLLGALDQAEKEARAIVDAPDASVFDRGLGGLCLAWVFLDRGLLAEAVDLSARTAAESEARGDAIHEGLARTVLAKGLLSLGDLDAAAREAEIAMERAVKDVRMRPMTLAVLAAVRLAQGRAAEALAAARGALWQDNATGMRMESDLVARLICAEALSALGEREPSRAALAAARAHVFELAGRIGDEGLRRSFLEDNPVVRRTLALSAELAGG